MTKKQRRNNLYDDFNTREDELILADLDVMLNDDETIPVPLQHFLDDDDAVESLLVKSNFNTNDDQEEDYKSLGSRLFEANDNNDLERFAVKPITSIQQVDDETVLESGFGKLQGDQDAFDKLLVDTGFDNPEEPDLENELKIEPIHLVDELSGSIQETLTENTLAGLVADAYRKPALDKHQKMDGDIHLVEKQEQLDPSIDLARFDDKNDDEADYGMVEELTNEDTGQFSPHESMIDLSAKAGIAARVEEQFQERGQMQVHEAGQSAKKTTLTTYAALALGLLALTSIVVMGVILLNMQTRVSRLTALVSILEEDMSSIAERNADTDIHTGNIGAASLIQRLDTPDNRLASVNVKNTVIEQNRLRKSAPPEAKKKRISLRQVSKPEEKKLKIPVLVKKKTQETKDKKAKVEHINKRLSQPVADWSVQLVAYKELAEAKSKAERLIQKGIPVKVVAVNKNKIKRYQLHVGGFQSRQKAVVYASKLKKSLKIHTVSVVH